MIEDFLGEVAMGIDETDAFTGRNIGQNQIAEERALPHSAFADQKKMLAPVRPRDAKERCPAPDTSVTNMADAIGINHAPEPNPRPINFISAVKKDEIKKRQTLCFCEPLRGMGLALERERFIALVPQ
jgi:hypothetical protein